jgi:hypothetical protein
MWVFLEEHPALVSKDKCKIIEQTTENNKADGVKQK